MNQPMPYRRYFVFLLLLSLLLTFYCPTSSRAQDSAKSKSAVVLAQIPINFEPNYGQVDPSAHFIARTGNAQLKIRPLGIDLALRGPAKESTNLKLDFLGANSEASITGSDRSAGESNYLVGRDPSKWFTHVPNFGRVTYANLYPGIDAVFYGNGQHLEHDFLIAPGADYHAIRTRILGAENISLSANGDVVISSRDGNLVFHRPVVYQLGARGRESRQGRFTLSAKNEIAFGVDGYDRSRPLIIDPVLDYQTFITSAYFLTMGVATDAAGDTYVSGVTTDTGAERVMKLNPSGTGLIYTTDIGNSCQPYGGIVVDANGNALVATTIFNTDVTGFPVKNPIPFGAQGNGSWYGYIFSLSADGSSLNYASLLGGGSQQFQSSSTLVYGIAQDANGNAYISGYTDSPVYPVTPGALNNNNVPPGNAATVVYATKFLPNGSLGYSALINGSGTALAIAADASGAYITGTAGPTWPITNGAFQSQIPGTSNPLTAPFVTKLSADGSSLIYSTFIGSDARPTAILLDGSGQAVIAGGGAPATFPVTNNAYQKALPPPRTIGSFLTKLNATGSQLVYSSFFYGNVNSSYSSVVTTGIAFDAAKNIWLTGTTNDPQFPLVTPLQTAAAGSSLSLPGFLAELDSSASTLKFSTFLGDLSLGAQSLSAVTDPQGKIHVAGITGWELYTSPGALIQSALPPPPNVDVLYGFVALIDPSVAAPWACLSNSQLNFGLVSVGSSASLTETISNCSNLPLTISGVNVSNSAFTVPSALNHCQQTLAINASCNFTVTFVPVGVTSSVGIVTIPSNAGEPPVLSLLGSGYVPTPPRAFASPSSLFFNPQFVGTASAAQGVSVTNQGQMPLTVDLTHTTITPGFTFTQSGCGSPILAFPCTFQVTFAPIAGGEAKGILSIATNDPVNATVISLDGLGLTAFPVPMINFMSPPSVLVGSATTTFQLAGINFFPTSVVLVNGVAQPTRFQDFSILYVTLDSSLFNTLGEIQLTVLNPAPGGGQSNSSSITVYQTLQVPAAAMIYEPVSKQLFAALSATAPTNPNTIEPIDPSTGKVGVPIPVGHDPEVLAVSDDGQYLYVGLYGDHTIQRVNLKTAAVDRTFSLPDPNLFVSQMGVVPGAPTQLVASLAVGGPAGIAAFNDSGLVNYIGNNFQDGYVQVTSFTFAGTPPLVYSIPSSSSTSVFNVFSVDSLGIHKLTVPAAVSQGFTGFSIFSDGAKIYSNFGQIWDPQTQTLLHTYSNAPYNAATVLPDLSGGATYFLAPYANYGGQFSGAVLAYDQKTLGLTGTAAFDPFYGSDMIGLARWGVDGFAFLFSTVQQVLGSGQVILFRSSIARGTSPDFTLAANPLITGTLMITSPGSKSEPITLAVTAENGFNGTINFTPSSCSITPAGSLTTCSFSAPGTVTGSGNVQLILQTTGPQTSQIVPSNHYWGSAPLAAVVVLAGLFFITLGMRIEKRVRIEAFIGVILFVALTATLHGCGASGGTGSGGGPGGTGGGGNTNSGTPTGVTYTVNVTAVASGGQPSHNLNLTFRVQ
jgi:Beta-propeller repeat